MIWDRIAKPISNYLYKKGYILQPHWRLQESMQERLLWEIFRDGIIDCVFDVGANKGQFRNFLRNDVGYKGLILSFEPLKHLVELCRDRAKSDPMWHIFDHALGLQETERRINVAMSDDLSSFCTQKQDMNPFADKMATVRSEVVRIKTLDSIFQILRDKYKFGNAYLKIDTQGFDAQVISGALGSLPDVFAMQCELSVVPLYEGTPIWTDVIANLKENRFEISGIFPIIKDRWSRVIEFDGVFINTRFKSHINLESHCCPV